MAVSPDGGTFALGTDRVIRLIAADGKPITQLTGHQQPVSHLCFAPDGDTLASAAEPGDASPLRFWHIATGEQLRRWGDAGRCVRGLAFTPDGQQLAVLEPDAVTLHNPRLGRFSADLPVPRGWTDLTRVAISRDGRSLAIGCETARRASFDVADRTVRYAGAAPGSCLAVQFHADNRRLMWADGYDLHVCDDDGKCYPFAAQCLCNATAVAQTADGAKLAVARGAELTLWDVAARKSMARLVGHRGEIRVLAFANNRTLVSAGEEGAMVWQLP